MARLQSGRKPVAWRTSPLRATKRQATTSVLPQTVALANESSTSHEASRHNFSRAANPPHEQRGHLAPRSVRVRLQSCRKPAALANESSTNRDEVIYEPRSVRARLQSCLNALSKIQRALAPETSPHPNFPIGRDPPASRESVSRSGGNPSMSATPIPPEVRRLTLPRVHFCSCF
jgi:hypothetical protein